MNSMVRKSSINKKGCASHHGRSRSLALSLPKLLLCDSKRQEVDGNGDIVLNTAGHPGGAGASGEFLAADYAPTALIIQVAASGNGATITVTGLAAPECTRPFVNMSQDDGQTWTAWENLTCIAAWCGGTWEVPKPSSP